MECYQRSSEELCEWLMHRGRTWFYFHVEYQFTEPCFLAKVFYLILQACVTQDERKVVGLIANLGNFCSTYPKDGDMPYKVFLPSFKDSCIHSHTTSSPDSACKFLFFSDCIIIEFRVNVSTSFGLCVDFSIQLSSPFTPRLKFKDLTEGHLKKPVSGGS